MYLSTTGAAAPVRFGFIVPKSVGVAVQRNLVRRRMKALSRDRLDSLAAGTEVVFRALPGAAQTDWDTLRSEIAGLLDAASENRRVSRS